MKNILHENTQNRTRTYAKILSCVFVFLFVLISVQSAGAVAGVPKILSYQGRLLDAAGNLLGGAGTDFCFKFSIYDNATVGAGTKLWPSATTSIMTINVKNGIFNAGIGDTAANGNELTYNFQDNDAVFLNVEVATKVGVSCTDGDEVFDNLAPRQRIVSSGYTINSDTVDGFHAAQSATGSQITALTAGNLILGGINPQLNATSTNTLTIQGGAGTGDIQFFSASNKITSAGNLTIAGTFSAGTSTVSGLTIGSLSGILKGSSGVVGTAIQGTDYGIINNLAGISTSTISLTGSGISISTTTNSITFTNIGVTSLQGGTAIGVNNATGTVTITNLGVQSLGAATGTITLTTPLTVTSGVLSMPTSTSGQSGYLSSADWSTFNSKITTTSLSVAYAPLAFNQTTGVFSLPTSTASQSGFLSSGDWTTFSAKGPYYWVNVGTNLYPTSTTWSVGIGTTTPAATLSIVGSSTAPIMSLYSQAASTTPSFYVASSGRVLVNTTATTTGQLNVVGTASGGVLVTVAGIYQESLLNPSASGYYQFGNRHIVNVVPTASSSLVGEFVRMIDNTSLISTVRAMELQAWSGTNTQGINTGLYSAGRTFGIQAITNSTAGGVVIPAAIFGELQGTTQGQVLRLYSKYASSTAQDFAQFFQETSEFKGTGLKMDFGRSGGSFTGNFIQLLNSNVTKFNVNATGTVMIGTSTSYGISNLVVCAQSNCTLPSATSTVAVFGSTGGTATSSSIVARGTITQGASDVGEYIYIEGASSDYEAGDLLAVSTATSTKFIKTTLAYQANLAGIVSKTAGFIGGGDLMGQPDAVIMALAGRAPVKITAENGPITPGDLITASSKPGFGMRANKPGRVVGMALDFFNGTGTESEGKIMTFVNPHWYYPTTTEMLQGGEPTTGEVLNTYTFDPNTIYSFENLKVQNLEVGSQERPNGITIYDIKTKQPYCVFTEDGAVKSIPGKCNEVLMNNLNIESSTPVSESPPAEPSIQATETQEVPVEETITQESTTEPPADSSETSTPESLPAESTQTTEPTPSSEPAPVLETTPAPEPTPTSEPTLTPEPPPTT